MSAAAPGPAQAPRPITHRRVLTIAVPIVVSNVTVPILGAVDTGVVGQMGAAAPIGAVGMGAVILTSFYWIFGFLRMGTSGLVAQAHGAGDHAEVSAGLWRALGVAALAGAALIALQTWLFALAFHIAPASAEVESLARDYLAIRIWGAPATIALYALTGWLIALERTRAVLAIQLVMNALNVGLDVLFVLHWDLGVRGVASATLIAEASGLILGLWCVRAALRPGLVTLAQIADRMRLRRMLSVNGDIMIRSVLLQASLTGFTFLAAGQGDVTLAANQVLLQFLAITSFALDGFAFATETLVGQAVGARSVAHVRRATWMPCQWGIALALALGAGFALGGGLVIDLMSTSPEVRAAARIYLPWLAVMPIISLASYMFDGAFIGATMSRDMRNAMALSVLAYGAALAAFVPLFGNHGLWAALVVLNATRGLSMARRFPRVLACAAR